jgi:hypothetical protein
MQTSHIHGLHVTVKHSNCGAPLAQDLPNSARGTPRQRRCQHCVRGTTGPQATSTTGITCSPPNPSVAFFLGYFHGTSGQAEPCTLVVMCSRAALRAALFAAKCPLQLAAECLPRPGPTPVCGAADAGIRWLRQGWVNAMQTQLARVTSFQDARLRPGRGRRPPLSPPAAHSAPLPCAQPVPHALNK